MPGVRLITKRNREQTQSLPIWSIEGSGGEMDINQNQNNAIPWSI